MTKLRDIQLAFQNSLQKQDDSVAHYIAKPPNMKATDRLQVYYNDYFFRLRDSLKDNFEITCKLLGDDVFESCVKAYLDAHPSTTYTLRDVGFSFSGFLQYCNEEPKIVEMACFEYEIIHALYSVDAKVLTLEALSAIAPEEWASLKLVLHPSVCQLICHYNTLNLWLALDNEEDILSGKLDEPVMNLIWRYDQRAYFRTTSLEETALFRAIEFGLVFPDLCEKMLEYFDEDSVVEWIAGVLQTWINDGFFSTPA